jgi:hypothetical protein
MRVAPSTNIQRGGFDRQDICDSAFCVLKCPLIRPLAFAETDDRSSVNSLVRPVLREQIKKLWPKCGERSQGSHGISGTWGLSAGMVNLQMKELRLKADQIPDVISPVTVGVMGGIT